MKMHSEGLGTGTDHTTNVLEHEVTLGTLAEYIAAKERYFLQTIVPRNENVADIRLQLLREIILEIARLHDVELSDAEIVALSKHEGLEFGNMLELVIQDSNFKVLE